MAMDVTGCHRIILKTTLVILLLLGVRVEVIDGFLSTTPASPWVCRGRQTATQSDDEATKLADAAAKLREEVAALEQVTGAR